jgi:hypothetical protein
MAVHIDPVRNSDEHVVPEDQVLGARLPGEAESPFEFEQRIRMRERDGLAALGDPADPKVRKRGAEDERELPRDGLGAIRSSAAAR